MKLRAILLTLALFASLTAAQQSQPDRGSVGGAQLQGESPNANPDSKTAAPNDARVEQAQPGETRRAANAADAARGDRSGLWGLLGLVGLLGLGRRTRDKFAERDRDPRMTNVQRMDDHERRAG